MVKARHHQVALRGFGFMLALVTLMPASGLFPAYPAKATPSAGSLKKPRVVTTIDEPRKWLTEEVSYIMTAEERATFERLPTGLDREQFIGQFWERRNPYPGVLENLFEERFYRRIAYANEEFSSTVPGWKTDRGRIFIMYGFPDEIEPHPSGGTLPVADERGIHQSVSYPFDVWRYQCVEGVGRNITVVFADPKASDDVHLMLDPKLGDPFEHAQRAQWHFGLQSQEDLAPCGTEPIVWRLPPTTRLDPFAKVDVLWRTELTGLSGAVASHLSLHQLPFQVRADFIPLTEATGLVPIALEVANRELQFDLRGDTKVARLQVYGQFSTLAGRVGGEFGRELSQEVPSPEFPKHVQASTLYQQLVPLPPGIYKLTIAVKDLASGRAGLTNLRVEVPALRPGMLCASSVILADSLEPAPKIQDYAQPFVVGATELRPNVGHSFGRGQTLGLYLQIHNVAFDATTHKPSLAVKYEILKGRKVLLSVPENVEALNRARAILTLHHRFPLNALRPGRYTLRVEALDHISKQSIIPSATFEVH